MGTMLSGRVLVDKLADFIDWLVQGRRQVVSFHPIDTLQQEIHQIEKTLADTRPSRVARRATPLEPITEQQKIIDLAGE